MKEVLILFLLVLSNITYSQTKEGMEICLAMQSNNFMSDTEAENALDKILDVIGASKNFILLPCDKINNAVATAYKGYRYILYDKQFMQQISYRTNDWSNLAILAHEVGHHINGHSLDILLYAGGAVESKSLEQKRQQELEADEFAGFILAKLGATMSNALSFTNIFSDKDDTYSTHPTKYRRIAAVKKGYSKGLGRLGKSQQISNQYEKRYSIKSTYKKPKEDEIPIGENAKNIRIGNLYTVKTSVYMLKEIDGEFIDSNFVVKKDDQVLIIGGVKKFDYIFSLSGYLNEVVEVLYKGENGFLYVDILDIEKN